jgi:hypothetical protein
MIFTGNHNRRRAAQNGQNNSQRSRRSSNIEVGKNKTIFFSFQMLKKVTFQGRSKNSSRITRENSRDSPSRSSYLPTHSSSPSTSSSYYSLAGTSSSYNNTYMTIPELDENKHDLLQKTRARDITKRRGAIKLIQRLTFVLYLYRSFNSDLTDGANLLISEFTKLMAINLLQNFFVSPRSVRIAKNSFGVLIR